MASRPSAASVSPLGVTGESALDISVSGRFLGDRGVFTESLFFTRTSWVGWFCSWSMTLLQASRGTA